MKKLKDIEEQFSKNGCWRSENNQKLIIKCCYIGHNSYDYGEGAPTKIDYSFCPEAENDPRINILMCGDCCCCGSW